MFNIRNFLLLLPAIFLSFTVHSRPYFDFEDLPTIDPDLPAIRYAAFPTPVSALNSTTVIERGQFRVPPIPAGQTSIPAVVIVHGSLGPDSRGPFYADALNDAGIATLELDVYSAHGIIPTSTSQRPNPLAVMQDIYGALIFLASQPGIDPDRIGLLGFSAGAVLTVITATGSVEPYFRAALTTNTITLKFAAFAAQYPVCYLYNKRSPVGYIPFESLTGPLIIQTGGKDSYSSPSTCTNLVNSLPADQQSLLTVNVYPKAYHAWDRLQPAETVPDQLAILNSGKAEVVPNIHDAVLSRSRIVDFFSDIFEISPP